MPSIQRRKSKFFAGLIVFAAIVIPIAPAKADTQLNVAVCQIMKDPTFSVTKKHFFTSKNNITIIGQSGESALVHEAVYRNNTLVYDGDSLRDGRFKTKVPLYAGTNTIVVVSSDGCGNTKSTDNLVIEQSSNTGFFSAISALSNSILLKLATSRQNKF